MNLGLNSLSLKALLTTHTELMLMAADAILRRANREVLSAHLSGCVRQALESGETGQIEKKLEELDSVLEKLSK